MKSFFATALALALTACGAEAEDSQTTAAPAAEETATAEPASTAEAEATPEAIPAETVPQKITVAGTIDSIVLDGEEPLVIVIGSDGTNYLGVTAPGAIDAVLDNTRGVGSPISLECDTTDLPPEDGFIWVEGCTLS